MDYKNWIEVFLINFELFYSDLTREIISESSVSLIVVDAVN